MPDHKLLATDLSLTFAEAKGTVRIEVCRDGTWKQESGTVEITPELRQSFVRNFRANVRKNGDLPIGYAGQDSTEAAGWITALENKGTSLFAQVKLTPGGRKALEDGEYRFFSPEWHPNYRDAASGKTFGPTLFGGLLTNRPLTGTPGVAFAEGRVSGGALSAERRAELLNATSIGQAAQKQSKS